MTDTARLPVPARLEPKQSKRTLMYSVRAYFYSLYNTTSAKFRDLLASVGNKDAVTGNRLFDRHEAVGMIKQAAKQAQDQFTAESKDGDIYRCIVNLMRKHDMGLKLRRREYALLTHSATPAE